MEKSLPKGWVETELGSVSEIITGNTPPKSVAEYYGNDILWVKPGDFHGQKVIFKTEEKLSDLGFQKSRKVPAGSILVTCIGNLGNISMASEDLATNQQINSIVITHDKLSKKYIYYYSLTLKKWLIDNSTSTTISMVNKSVFEKAPVIFPPLAEQKRIVAKLDKLFYKIDCVRKSIEILIKLKNKFFESIFYESAGLTTLSNFVEERNKRVGENWFEYDKIGVSAKDGIIDLDVGTKKTFERYKIVEPGDIIYNTMRINIGSIAIYEGNSPAITSPDYVVFRVKKASKYLVLNYLKSEGGKINISSVTTGSVRSRLYFKNLVNIPFPEITSERHKSAESILKWFESSLAKIRVIDTDLLNKLSKAILHKAFKGELVSQLPTDGDAKDLLADIMALKRGTDRKRGKI